VSSPARDASELCSDVGALRVCWAEAGAVFVSARPVPAAAAASPLGWRCAGAGAARACVDRLALAPLFSCAGARCTQRHARRPDDGEWTCAEMAGAEICAGGEPPAGVVAGPPDPGWLCGARRARARLGRGAAGPRVCVDFSPDFPDGDLAAWRCRAVNELPGGRVCERDVTAARLTLVCDRAHPCVDGARCASGRCVPAPPAPSCWLDGDCDGGRCRFGSCVTETAP
jgi:hypothetical protein